MPSLSTALPCLFLAALLGWEAPAQAQQPHPRPNIVRLDAAYPLAQAISQHAQDGPSGFGVPLPLPLSYEHHLAGRFSLNTELFLNVGDQRTRESWLAVQSRYYLGRPARAHQLLGGYLAPLLSVRTAREYTYTDQYIRRTEHSVLAGGLLVGAQLPCGSRFTIDLAGGAQLPLGQLGFSSHDQVFGGQPSPQTDTGYPLPFLDGRLGVGYRF